MPLRGGWAWTAEGGAWQQIGPGWPVGTGDDAAVDVPTGDLPHPRAIWSRAAWRQLPDAYGCGRIPAFWFTLNLPYNYLFEIHRFQRATRELAGSVDVAGRATEAEAEQAGAREARRADPRDAARRAAGHARRARACGTPYTVPNRHASRRVGATSRSVSST